ncbi:hypothetical protein D3C80_448650 [compost metagenome]
MIWLPEEDGITHVNVYSRGATSLGRRLTNFAETPFVHPTDGPFQSVEGYWYWLKTGQMHDDLRQVSGWYAKKLGRKKPLVPCPPFDGKIKVAIRAKLIAHPDILRDLIDNELPLTHYYVYHESVINAGYEWINEYYMQVRESCIVRGYRP